MIIVPPSLFMDLNSSFLVTSGALIFQDKASLCTAHFIKKFAKIPASKIIEARAGSGKLSIQSLILKELKPFKFLVLWVKMDRFLLVKIGQVDLDL